MKCTGCNGKGKYTGLQRVEDPCSHCGGTGREPDSDLFVVRDDPCEAWYVVPKTTLRASPLTRTEDGDGIFLQMGDLVGIERKGPNARFVVLKKDHYSDLAKATNLSEVRRGKWYDYQEIIKPIVSHECSMGRLKPKVLQ